MQHRTAKVAVRSFQQKLDTFKTKIQFQQLLAQALSVEFESLKQLFDASLLKIESTSSEFDVTSPIHELSALIRRSAGEFLKIDYSQPNIPDRMAEIVLAFKEKTFGRGNAADYRCIQKFARA
ncbi:MAG TPA: hypothetical protein DDW65_05055 [Firmicutes bacterium]|nr:hypothetical protein [Bacillota bacterium]